MYLVLHFRLRLPFQSNMMEKCSALRYLQEILSLWRPRSSNMLSDYCSWMLKGIQSHGSVPVEFDSCLHVRLLNRTFLDAFLFLELEAFFRQVNVSITQVHHRFDVDYTITWMDSLCLKIVAAHTGAVPIREDWSVNVEPVSVFLWCNLIHLVGEMCQQTDNIDQVQQIVSEIT